MADYQGKPPSLGYPSRSTGRPQALGAASESSEMAQQPGWLQRSREAQSRALRQMSPRKTSRASSR